MNEDLNLVEKLKDCPEGTKSYSAITGEVDFVKIDNSIRVFPIMVKSEGRIFHFTQQGKFYNMEQGECIIFPSKDQRDWSKFKVKVKVKTFKPKFNPNTLQPFDKVLVRDDSLECWEAQLFSHIIKDENHFPYVCTNDSNRYCIPYNDDTKHLVGTTDEAPEFYRYWRVDYDL